MKDFGAYAELLCSYSQAAFPLITLDEFETITVEPVPLIKDNFDYNLAFSEAVERHEQYHQKRIEREGRG